MSNSPGQQSGVPAARSHRFVPALASWFVLALTACADGSAPLAPALELQPQESRAGLACASVDLAGTGALGFIPAGLEGAGSIGALPAATTFAGITGMLHSYITNLLPVGVNAQGATHITLVHVFNSGLGTFHTDDKAVCAPNPGGPGTCLLSDQMTIASGTGAFEQATGKLHNRGVLDFNSFMLTFHATGRICGLEL